MYIPTYIRTYIRTYVHTYMHMYMRVCMLSRERGSLCPGAFRATSRHVMLRLVVPVFIRTFILIGLSLIIGNTLFPNIVACYVC